MAKRAVEILLVENDIELAEMMEGYLHEALPVRVTVAGSVDEALCEELTCRHDVVLSSLSPGDGDGLHLVRQLRMSNRCPVILMADHPSAEQVIEAMRLGVRDVLVQPFEFSEMAEAVRRSVVAQKNRLRRARRNKRLRKLTARIVGERRDLRQRTSLICQDLVYAYRDLARKVTETGVLTEDMHQPLV